MTAFAAGTKFIQRRVESADRLALRRYEPVENLVCHRLAAHCTCNLQAVRLRLIRRL
ncbi:MAG TPA: hypothetical protein VKE51_06155 [Vicinamibacterales bacterium]|nr:hypothetical protein [Vicinamibacterales bacterium]